MIVFSFYRFVKWSVGSDVKVMYNEMEEGMRLAHGRRFEQDGLMERRRGQ